MSEKTIMGIKPINLKGKFLSQYDTNNMIWEVLKQELEVYSLDDLERMFSIYKKHRKRKDRFSKIRQDLYDFIGIEKENEIWKDRVRGIGQYKYHTFYCRINKEKLTSY